MYLGAGDSDHWRSKGWQLFVKPREGCLTGDKIFSSGTQWTHGDLIRRELRNEEKNAKNKQSNKKTCWLLLLSTIRFLFLLVLPLIDPSSRSQWENYSRRNILMAIIIILSSPTTCIVTHWPGFLCLKLLASVMSLSLKRYWNRHEQANHFPELLVRSCLFYHIFYRRCLLFTLTT